MSPVYVYALVEAKGRRFRFDQHRVEFLPVSGLYAAVERLPSAPALSESMLRKQHELVARLARRVDAILPARFGAWMELDELEQVIAMRRGTLQEAFDRVRGADQMTVRIFGAARKGTRAAPPQAERTGTDYLRLRRAAKSGSSAEGDAIRQAVTGLVRAERVDPGRGSLRAVLHHLVPRGRATRYVDLVHRASATLPGSVRVTVSGPWPPFAFTPELQG